MAAGLGLARIAPRDFWAMTPGELAAVLEGLMGHKNYHRFDRTALGELMKQFPDI